jgi:hypothetical protein
MAEDHTIRIAKRGNVPLDQEDPPVRWVEAILAGEHATHCEGMGPLSVEALVILRVDRISPIVP